MTTAGMKGSDGRSSTTLALWVTIIFSSISAVYGGGAYFQKNDELSTAKDALSAAQTQRDTAKEQLGVAKGQLETAEANSRVQQATIDQLLREKIDPTTATLESVQKLLSAADGDAGRRSILQSFARKLRESSRRQTPLLPFTTPLPSGLAESARLLSELLEVYPLKVDLNGVDLHGHFWRGAQIDGILLRDTDLRAVDFSRGSLSGALLEDSEMRCANLQRVKLDKAQMTGTDLSFANLRGVDLSLVTGLTIEQLTGIDYDEQTQFPTTLDRSQLEPPTTYGEARTCAQSHLRPTSASEPAPVGGAAASTPSSVPSPTAVGEGQAPTPTPSTTLPPKG